MPISSFWLCFLRLDDVHAFFQSERFRVGHCLRKSEVGTLVADVCAVSAVEHFELWFFVETLDESLLLSFVFLFDERYGLLHVDAERVDALWY